MSSEDQLTFRYVPSTQPRDISAITKTIEKMNELTENVEVKTSDEQEFKNPYTGCKMTKVSLNHKPPAISEASNEMLNMAFNKAIEESKKNEHK